MEVLSLKGISKSYDKKIILNKFDLSVEKGDILAVLGPSGSGKSCLIKMLIGFISPTTGTIKRNAVLGFSMQNNSLYENLTLEQNLQYFSKLYEIEEKQEKINQLLEGLSLQEYKKTLVSKISGGTKKRVDLACALLNNPQVIILDEPFAGLDTFLVNKFSKFLLDLQKQGLTIILSSHLLDQASEFCNKFIFIKDKNVTIITKKDIKELYKQ